MIDGLSAPATSRMECAMPVWLNGAFIDDESAAVSVRDTGLLHAAGVFTTMRAYGGRIFRLDRHLARLRRSCEALFVPLQQKDEELAEAAGGLLKRNSLGDARLRITVTRGASRRDPLHGLHLSPTVLVTAAELEPYPAEFYQRGLTVTLLDEQKLNPYDVQAGHKTLNYFSRLTALRSANEQGAGEALWFNVHNSLQSGSISNVFVVSGGVLMTPPTPDEMHDSAIRDAMPYPRSAVLPGITRAAVIEAAESAGIQVRRAAIDINALLSADEVFVTNSVMTIMPVCHLERKVVGDERPGPITRKLAARFEAMVREECDLS